MKTQTRFGGVVGALLGCFLLGLGCLSTVLAAESPSTLPEEGRALAAELAGLQPDKNYVWSGVLQVSNPSTDESHIPVTVRIFLEPNGWRKEFEAAVTNGNFREKLVVIRDDAKSIRYFLNRCKFGEAFGELAAVPPDQLYQSFAQTDFSLLDLGLDFFLWPKQAIIKRDNAKTLPCRVLESVPAEVTPSGYGKVLSWIAIKNDGLMRAEVYDATGKKWKVFDPRRVAKINGRYELKEVEIRNLLTGSRTRLEFNFDPQGLTEQEGKLQK